MKLRSLRIRNFKQIGTDGIEVLIDRIVILVGPNNCGKSTVLDAYEAFANSGSTLELSCFHNEQADAPVEIEGLFNEVTVEDKATLGSAWAFDDNTFGHCIRIKWVWTVPETKGAKYSWDPTAGAWQSGGMGGWDTLVASRIPYPLRIRPTDPPSERENQIVAILAEAVKASLKQDSAKISETITAIERLANELSETVQTQLTSTCNLVQERLSEVFEGLTVSLKKSVGKLEPEKIIGSGSHLRIARGDNPSLPLQTQGTGLQRAFLWSALGALADSGYLKGKRSTDADRNRQKILLIDEPESFLHPPAVRDARESLYRIAELPNWQVIATTHSPVFVDVSKEHTTIVRVESNSTNRTRVFQTDLAGFTDDERTALSMIRACHPTVNEFFFAEKVLLVEGDTELAVLLELKKRSNRRDIQQMHIVNCLGKGNLTTFVKILNQFGTPYIVIHDSDCPHCRKSGGRVRNSAWTINGQIRDALAQRPADFPVSRLLVHVPDFETHYFGRDELSPTDKPFGAITKLRAGEFLNELGILFEQIVDGSHPCFYSTEGELNSKLEAFRDANFSTEDNDLELWQLR